MEAVLFRCSDGNRFTLHVLLGYSDLTMVEHYARVCEVHMEQAHRKASPADNWHL